MDRGAGPHRVRDDLLGRQPPLRNVETQARSLGDLPVLAEHAVERAADRRDRIRERARLHVEQRLLLDRVEAGRGHGAVRQAPQRPVAVLAHAADPRAPGPHEAPMGADPAADAAVGQGLGEDRGDRVGVGTVEQRHVVTPGVSRVPAGRSSAARDASGGTSALSSGAAAAHDPANFGGSCLGTSGHHPGARLHPGHAARPRRRSAAGRDPTRRAGAPPRPGPRCRRRRGRRTAGHGTGCGPGRGAAAGPSCRRLRHADRAR